MSAEVESKNFRLATESHRLIEDIESLAPGTCKVSLSPHLMQLLGVSPGDFVTFIVREDGIITVEGEGRNPASNEEQVEMQELPIDAEQLPLFDTPQDTPKHHHRKE